MKKLSVILCSIISTGVIAATGHGYTILEHKVTVSPGINAYSIDKSTQKKTINGNGAQAYGVTTKINVGTRVHGDHEVDIQNYSGYTKVYKFGYWLKVMDKLYRVDDKVQINAGGVFMQADESHMENLIFPRAATYQLEACTYSDAAATICSHAGVSAIR